MDTDSVFVNPIRDNVTGCVTFMIGEWGQGRVLKDSFYITQPLYEVYLRVTGRGCGVQRIDLIRFETNTEMVTTIRFYIIQALIICVALNTK